MSDLGTGALMYPFLAGEVGVLYMRNAPFNVNSTCAVTDKPDRCHVNISQRMSEGGAIRERRF